MGPFLLVGTREVKELLIEKARSDRRACHEAGSPGSQPWRPGLFLEPKSLRLSVRRVLAVFLGLRKNGLRTRLLGPFVLVVSRDA